MDFTYTNILNSKIKSPYLAGGIVFNTSGNVIETSKAGYAEFLLENQYSGHHIKLVLKNRTSYNSNYTVAAANSEFDRSVTVSGTIDPLESKIILLPCPLGFNKIISSYSAGIDIIGLFVAEAEFSNSAPLNTPELFKILNVVSRSVVPTNKLEIAPSFLLSPGYYSCSLTRKESAFSHLAIKIITKKAKIKIGETECIVCGIAHFCFSTNSVSSFLIDGDTHTSISSSLVWNTPNQSTYVKSSLLIWRLENHAKND